MPCYARQALPQWTIEDVIKHRFTYYFGLASIDDLTPSQRDSDYSSIRFEQKRALIESGVFDPIIVDCEHNVICGHHRLQVCVSNRSPKLVPIICLEGVTIEQVVRYEEQLRLHHDAQLDWLAEQDRTAEWHALYNYG